MCIFCEIIKGNIPSSKIYEDDKCIAILDLAQVTKGHTLVMPKQHYDTSLQCDDETLAHIAVITKKLANQIMEKTGATGCNILNNSQEVAGQTVMHMHIHIIPRYGKDDGFNPVFNETHEPYDLKEIAELITK